MVFNATDDSVSDTFSRLTKPKKQESEPRVEVAQAAPTVASDAGGQPPAAGGEAKDPYLQRAELQNKLKILETVEANKKKAESEAKSAAEKQRQAAIYEQYKPELTKKFEPFEAPKDTFQGLASLGMMLMAVGSMGGKKGLTSATGAMNAIAGMATGYQQGRKEEFDRQKQIFDENFRIMKENQAQIQKEFEYALKYAQKDLPGATAKLATNLRARGMDAAATALTENKGTIQTVQDQTLGPMMKGLTAAQQAKLQLENEINTQNAKIESQKAGHKTTAKNYLVDGKVELLTEPEALARKNAGANVQLAGSTSMRLGAPLTDESQEKLAQKVAIYALDPKTLSVKDRAAVLERAFDLNPNFDQRDYGNQNIVLRNWTQPNGYGTKQIAAFTTVAQHLDTLQELADAQTKSDIPRVNSMINYFKTNLGYPEVTNFETARQAVAAEVVKAITGTAGAVTDRVKAEQELSAASSPEQIKGAINTIKKLIGGRIETARTLYTAGTGKSPEEFNRLLPENIRSSFAGYAPSLGPSGGATGTQSAPHRPTTDAEYNKIKKGEYFVDPDDGKIYRK